MFNVLLKKVNKKSSNHNQHEELKTLLECLLPLGFGIYLVCLFGFTLVQRSQARRRFCRDLGSIHFSLLYFHATEQARPSRK